MLLKVFMIKTHLTVSVIELFYGLHDFRIGESQVFWPMALKFIVWSTESSRADGLIVWTFCLMHLMDRAKTLSRLKDTVYVWHVLWTDVAFFSQSTLSISKGRLTPVVRCVSSHLDAKGSTLGMFSLSPHPRSPTLIRGLSYLNWGLLPTTECGFDGVKNKIKLAKYHFRWHGHYSNRFITGDPLKQGSGKSSQISLSLQ